MSDPAAEALFDALEAQGILGQIRAMLRTAVFTSVDEHERDSGAYVHNPKALAMMRSAEGVRSTCELQSRLWQLRPLHFG